MSHTLLWIHNKDEKCMMIEFHKTAFNRHLIVKTQEDYCLQIIAVRRQLLCHVLL